MAWTASVLVVANVTADSDELLEALRRRADSAPSSFSLLVPATGGGSAGRVAASERLGKALVRMRAAGLDVDGSIGDADPIVAVHDTWDPTRFDAIVVSTLPTHESRWLMVDLPHRVARITGVEVEHVIAREPRRPPRVAPAPVHEKPGILAPLTPLAWGGAREQPRH
jgi:hypothetical protein